MMTPTHKPHVEIAAVNDEFKASINIQNSSQFWSTIKKFKCIITSVNNEN